MENKVMEASGAKNLIEVKNLTKKFGELLVLDDISENIRLGERVAIIGPSGSGKSTFLRCLNVLEDPTAGRIFFDGVDLADRKVNINEHRENGNGIPAIQSFQQPHGEEKHHPRARENRHARDKEIQFR